MNKFSVKSVGGRFFLTFFLSLGLLCAAFIASVGFGAVSMSVTEFFGGLFALDGYDLQTLIIYNIRLPRTLAAVVCGVGLSVSGAVL